MFLYLVKDGGTALLDTAYNGHLKIIEILIASKANINHQDNVSCLWLGVHVP